MFKILILIAFVPFFAEARCLYGPSSYSTAEIYRDLAKFVASHPTLRVAKVGEERDFCKLSATVDGAKLKIHIAQVGRNGHSVEFEKTVEVELSDKGLSRNLCADDESGMHEGTTGEFTFPLPGGKIDGVFDKDVYGAPYVRAQIDDQEFYCQGI